MPRLAEFSTFQLFVSNHSRFCLSSTALVGVSVNIVLKSLTFEQKINEYLKDSIEN